MKTTSTPELDQDAVDELRPEYNLNYRKARPNRFARQIDKSQVVVMLDTDISEVFTTPESVNAILRTLIKTMPMTPYRRPQETGSHQMPSPMRIVQVYPQPNWVLSVVAEDGRVGEFDVRPYLSYEAFEDLRRPGEFMKSSTAATSLSGSAALICHRYD